MIKLPVFSTVGQALSVFGLYFGKILPWALIVLVIGIVPMDLASHFLEKSILAGGPESPEVGFWSTAAFASILWFAFSLTPFIIKINQLAVFGRSQALGYPQALFSGRTLRFLGYAVLVGIIFVAGMTLALMPLGISVGVAMGRQPLPDAANVEQFATAFAQMLAGSGMVNFGLLVSVALGIAFAVLALPFHLVFPALAVEERASLARAYNLANGNKLRLCCCVLPVVVFFLALNVALLLMGKAFNPDQSMGARLILLPLTHVVMFFDVVTAKSVYAVAYRILSGLPDPRSAGRGRETGP